MSSPARALLALAGSTGERSLVVVSGLSFLGLLGVAFFFAAVRPAAWYPSPFGEQSEIELFFAESRPQVRALAAVQALIALSFL